MVLHRLYNFICPKQGPNLSQTVYGCRTAQVVFKYAKSRDYQGKLTLIISWLNTLFGQIVDVRRSLGDHQLTDISGQDSLCMVSSILTFQLISCPNLGPSMKSVVLR